MKQEVRRNRNICSNLISSEDVQVQAPTTDEHEKQTMHAVEESQATQQGKEEQDQQKTREPPQQNTPTEEKNKRWCWKKGKRSQTKMMHKRRLAIEKNKKGEEECRVENPQKFQKTLLKKARRKQSPTFMENFQRKQMAL